MKMQFKAIAFAAAALAMGQAAWAGEVDDAPGLIFYSTSD